MYLALLVIFIVLHGKDYYLSGAYPMLFAGGAVAIEGAFTKSTSLRGKLWPKAAIAAIIGVAGGATAPLALPLLSPANYVAYQDKLHVKPSKTDVNHNGPLPQFLGDQFGWPELTAEVGGFYNALPPSNARALRFSLAITVRLAQLICSDRSTDCRRH